jgi:hypothetical protein
MFFSLAVRRATIANQKVWDLMFHVLANLDVGTRDRDLSARIIRADDTSVIRA